MNLEDYIKDLDPELQERARACGGVEELLALAKEAKVPVLDEALEAIAGGEGGGENCQKAKCPRCGSQHVFAVESCGYIECKCLDCGYTWRL